MVYSVSGRRTSSGALARRPFCHAPMISMSSYQIYGTFASIGIFTSGLVSGRGRIVQEVRYRSESVGFVRFDDLFSRPSA